MKLKLFRYGYRWRLHNNNRNGCEWKVKLVSLLVNLQISACENRWMPWVPKVSELVNIVSSLTRHFGWKNWVNRRLIQSTVHKNYLKNTFKNQLSLELFFKAHYKQTKIYICVSAYFDITVYKHIYAYIYIYIYIYSWISICK